MLILCTSYYQPAESAETALQAAHVPAFTMDPRLRCDRDHDILLRLVPHILGTTSRRSVN